MNVLVKQLAEWLGASWEGDGEREITEVADIAAARANEIAFASGSGAAQQAARSSAGCLVVAGDFPETGGRTVIRVKDPRAAFIRVVSRFHPPQKPAPGIHPTAVIASGAELGEAVAVGAYSTIGAGTRIGARTSIGAGCHVGEGSVIGENGLLHSNVTIYDAVEIGRNVIIHSGAVLGADGFGFAMAQGRYEKFPQIGRVVIGDDVEIGANSCIDRAALRATRIGDGTKLDNMVQVAHNVVIGKHVVIAAQTGISGGTIIEDYVIIGGQVGIGDKARIQTRAILGSKCGILNSKIVRSDQAVWGVPARPLKQYLEQLAHLSKIASLRQDVANLKKRVARLGGT